MRSTLSSPWRSLTRRKATFSLHSPSRQLSNSTALKTTAASQGPRFARGLPSTPFSSLPPLQFNSLNVGLRSHVQIPAIPSTLRSFTKSHSLKVRPAASRAYSTLHSAYMPNNLQSSQNVRQHQHLMLQRRAISGVGSSSQNLLAHMEQTANNNPGSATAQNAFYSALLRADMPAIVAERYQSGRFATNSSTETTYQKALEKLGKPDGLSGYGANGLSAYGTGASMQGRDTMSNEQLQLIGQAVAAQMRGAQIASPKANSSGTGEKSSPLYVVVEESRGSKALGWIKFVAYYLLVAYLAAVVVSVFVEVSGLAKKVSTKPANEAKPQNQTVRFSDVQGCEEAKEELKELVEFLKDPAKFSNLGGKLPKGVLLTGPPGTGKTLLARAVAGEAGVPFFFASGSEFDEMYVGVGAKRIRELFNSARAKAPAIIFIDELDAIGSKRVDRDPAYVKQSLNQLLTELDGFSQDTGVIIIAATNLPNLLDKALTRPGRFDRNVVVPLPDVRGRAAILKHHLKKVKAASDVDETVIARSTTGFSGADLENLVNQAAVRASRNKSSQVTTVDLDWSKDKILMGAERRSAVIQDKDKLVTAYHEAGHALVGYYTPAADPLYKVTIMPRGPALGITHYLPQMDRVSMMKKELLARIDCFLGGKLAEEIIYGPDGVTTGCSSDLESATKIAYSMVTEWGMSTTLGDAQTPDYRLTSGKVRSDIEAEVSQILKLSRERGEEILNAHRTEFERVARALVEYETLTRDEMIKVMKGEKLPNLTTSKGSVIKLPEIPLPPGIATAAKETGEKTEPSTSGESRGGGETTPPESGDGNVKM